MVKPISSISGDKAEVIKLMVTIQLLEWRRDCRWTNKNDKDERIALTNEIIAHTMILNPLLPKLDVQIRIPTEYFVDMDTRDGVTAEIYRSSRLYLETKRKRDAILNDMDEERTVLAKELIVKMETLSLLSAWRERLRRAPIRRAKVTATWAGIEQTDAILKEASSYATWLLTLASRVLFQTSDNKSHGNDFDQGIVMRPQKKLL